MKSTGNKFVDKVIKTISESCPEKGTPIFIPDPSKLTDEDFRRLEEWVDEEEEK